MGAGVAAVVRPRSLVRRPRAVLDMHAIYELCVVRCELCVASCEIDGTGPGPGQSDLPSFPTFFEGGDASASALEVLSKFSIQKGAAAS